MLMTAKVQSWALYFDGAYHCADSTCLLVSFTLVDIDLDGVLLAFWQNDGEGQIKTPRREPWAQSAEIRSYSKVTVVPLTLAVIFQVQKARV